MNKLGYTVVILLALFGIVGIFLGIRFFLTMNNQTPGTVTTNTTGNGLPNIPEPVGTNQVPIENTKSLASENGDTLMTRDFLKDSATKSDPSNAGQYYLGNLLDSQNPDVTTSSSPSYVIEYIDKTSYFNITLLHQPLGQARLNAEQYIMTHLGISQSQMCNLKYTVSVPVSVDSVNGGNNLGFSFCPGATPLN